MNIVFRTDASLDIGNGHVIRCLTLATELQRRGAVCQFVCAETDGNLIALVRQRGFDVCALALDCGNTDATPGAPGPAHLRHDWEQDARSTASYLVGKAIDWLIVDHYALDARWEGQLRPVVRHLMVIDDLANRPHLCELLLDQNLGRNSADYDKLTPPGCVVLTGPRFALLQPQFSRLRQESLQRRSQGSIGRILITMGGADTEDATGKVLEALQTCDLPESIKLTVILGPHAPFRERVVQLSRAMPWETEVLVNVSNMAECMARSDLAIGAAGTTSWERCCLGLPTLLLVLADNQRGVAHALQDLDGAILLPDLNSLNAHLPDALRRVRAAGVLPAMVKAAAAVTDGGGVNRVIEHLEARTHHDGGLK